MKISVCMATYNGSKFISKQIESILFQLKDGDELIIVDDCSSDNTQQLIENINDSRILFKKNKENRGEIYTFNRSLMLSKNEIIFLSDQDDIWLPNRVKSMTEALLSSDASLLTSNFSWIDKNDIPVDIPFDGVKSLDSKRHFKNITDIFLGKTNYFGCAMIFKKSFLEIITPIPSFVESHDLWIALASNINKSNVHMQDKTFLKRKHDDNATETISRRPLIKKLFSRLIFIFSIFTLVLRSIFRSK